MVFKNRNLPESKFTIDVRIMASTSEDLNFKAQNGEFDPELLDLISRAYINIEPLRKDETIFLHSLNTF